jgi:hypothetical protein
MPSPLSESGTMVELLVIVVLVVIAVLGDDPTGGKR